MNTDKFSNYAKLTVKSIEQARLLAEPIKLRIIQEIAAEARTTKQIAEILGEKPTRLYRHVDALHDADLIKLVEKKQKRGTVEKYFLAVAQLFEVHPNLFAPPGDEGESVLDEILHNSYSEIRHAIKAAQAVLADEEGLQPYFLKFSVQATEANMESLRQQLLKWQESCEKIDRTTRHKEDVRWSGLLAFYPNTRDGEPSEN